MGMIMQKITCEVSNADDQEYDAFLTRVNSRLITNCESGVKPLFTTDAENLWGLYLSSFTDPAERQYHDCHACRQFIEHFGPLAIISLEAYSREARIEGLEEPHAAGLLMTKNAGEWNAIVRVWSGGRSIKYNLDRWD